MTIYNTFDARYGGMAPPISPINDPRNMLLRSIMTPQIPGVSLPTVAPPPPPSVPPSAPPVEPSVNPAAPIRMPDPAAVDAWRTSVDQDIAGGNTKIPVNPNQPLPRQSVPYAGNPTISQGSNGVTLNETPAAPGWAGSVGMGPVSPEEKAGFMKGQNWEKLMSAGDDIQKAIKGKQGDATAAAAATINPTSTGSSTSQELAQKAGLSQSLMSDIMQRIAMNAQRRPMGLSLPTRRVL